jgi:hypothetical protein
VQAKVLGCFPEVEPAVLLLLLAEARNHSINNAIDKLTDQVVKRG